MDTRRIVARHLVVALVAIALVGCSPAPSTPAGPKLKVGLVVDSGSENDKSFNEYTLKGAREAATAAGLDFFYLTSQSDLDYERHVESLVSQGANLVITVGFRMGDATAKAARRHPNIKFAIVDVPFFPGAGCAETATDCYSAEGGLTNVTSLTFAEDQVGYLAGVLAGCMTRSGTVATVAGLEIPPVARYVNGFERGARSVSPGLVMLHRYIPDFDDPATGKVVAQGFIQQGADVIFVAAGNTGNGGLLAAKEAGRMAIGVDVDQYFSYPDVRDALLTSAAKNMDVATAAAVRDFAAGQLASGIRTSTLANGGIGLAPYHDWDDRIPQSCKDRVAEATSTVKADPTITGAS